MLSLEYFKKDFRTYLGFNPDAVAGREILAALEDAKLFKLPLLDFGWLDSDFKNTWAIAQEMHQFGLFRLPYPSVFLHYGWTRVANNEVALPEIDQSDKAVLIWESPSGHVRYNKASIITVDGHPTPVLDAMVGTFLGIENGEWKHDIDYSEDPVASQQVALINAREAKLVIATLILSLSAKGVQVQEEVVPPKRYKDRRDIPRRKWPKMHVVKLGNVVGRGEGTGKGTPKRIHFRRGHIWGIKTRPPEEQRWVPPTIVNASMEGSPSTPIYDLQNRIPSGA